MVAGLAGGKGGAAEAQGTAATKAATAAEEAPAAAAATETAGTSVPVGEPAAAKGNPYGVATAPKMEMVDSTTVQKLGYNADKDHLWVEFRNGGVYRYKGVPEEVFNRLKDSESQGSFIARNIKGRYGVEYMGTTTGRKY